MFWNYRVVRRQNPSGETTFSIHEAYYDEDGNVGTITTEPVQPQGETFEELKKDLEWYYQAFNRPVLEYSQFPTQKFVEEMQSIKSEDMIPLEEVLSDLSGEFDDERSPA